METTPLEDAIEAIYAEYAASLIAGDADRWAAQWTDDGVSCHRMCP